MNLTYRRQLACSFALLITLPLMAATTRIWVMNYDSGTIDVIDPATNKIVQTITGIPNPHAAVFSPDGKRAYVSSETTEHNLYVVDTKTGETLNKVLLSGRPNLPAITKDGRTVAVCIREPGPPVPIGNGPLHNFHKDNTARVATKPGAVDFIDTESLAVTTVPTKVSLHDCYATPDGNYIVAGSSEGKFAEVFDVQTKKPVWEVDFDRGVLTMSFEVGPDGSTRRMFVNLDKWRGFAVVDFATHKEVDRIRFPDEPPELHSNDPHFGPNDTHGNIISSDGKTLWIGVIGGNEVFAYSLPDLKLKGYVPVPVLQEPGNPSAGGVPSWLAITPDGRKLYVALQGSNSISEIDTKRMKEVARILVGKDPKRLATFVAP
ncbi:MAG: hypothetical protein ACRD3Q_19200 [Terriglobales bacterium]